LRELTLELPRRSSSNARTSASAISEFP
jgi:hypothetical protein